MRTAQMEDDVHRVLQLARSQRVLSKARSKTSTNKNNKNSIHTNKTNHLKKEHEIRQVQAASTSIRHRHAHTTQDNTQRPATSLVQAKTQALMAIYGLRTADPAANQSINNCDRSEDSVVSETTRQELLDVRRRIYRNHFSGLQATYGPSGRPKLDTLIDAAMDAKRTHCSIHSSTGTIGAAVLTSANRIYTAGRIESVHHASLDVCAERAVLLKVTEYQQQQQQHRFKEVEVVEAMVICSDQRGLLLPTPCGACRELLAEFGDFPVFLLNADHESQETRSFELFPHARRHQLAATATTVAHQRTATTGTNKTPTNKSTTSQVAMDVRDWSCEQVAQWLVDVVELPQYERLFLDKRVDGATLWLLQDSDLQLLLGVTHPLHRRRVLLHIDRLKDRELLDHGIDFGQLQDYLAVLDGDRLDVVAQLKTTFDRLDQNKDGFLDFAELKSALQSLDLDVDLDGTRSSALLTEQLLQSLAGSRGSSGEISFPVFVKAFSQLAQLPAGELRDAPNVLFPTVDLVALRKTFDRADTNKSGSLDESEVAQLLESMGRFDNCQQRARAWFQHVDENGDARLSFPEFFLRYAQLTKLDLSAIQSLFTSEKQGEFVTHQAVERALHKLYPHVAMANIQAWCQRRPWADSGEKSLTFATFALACVAFGHALQSRVEKLQRMQRVLHNDALCHRSRIVHLQQSGHVRLCRHPGGSGGEEEEDQEEPKEKEEVSLVERRRRSQVKNSGRVSRRHTREETKEDDEEEEEGEEEEEEEVSKVFQRFASAGNKTKAPLETSHRQCRRRSRRKEVEEDDGKQQSSEEDTEEEEELRLNAVEAAQALLELGVVCSREQLLRYLDREGFGLRRCLSKHEFARIWKRLQLLQAMPRGLKGSEKETKQRELWEAIGRASADRLKPQNPPQRTKATTPQHANRRDYDAYLRSKHTHGQQKRSGQREEEEEGKEGEDEGKKPRRSRQRSRELRRSQSRKRRTRSSSSTSSSSSSSSSHSRRDRGRSRSRSRSQRRRRHRQDSSRSTRTANSSRSPSSSSSSSSSSSRRRKSRKNPPRSRPPCFRGLEVGDRVTSHAHNGVIGTLVRVYRDFFVADVHFDSGVRAKNVDLSQLRRVAPENQTKTPTNQKKEEEQRKRRAMVVGVSVRMAHKGTTAAFRKATILTCRSDGTFDVVANEHGEQELLRRVPLSQLQLLRKPVVYSEAQRVTVRRVHEYLRGRVVVCRTNGTYDVRLAKGGTVLREVAWELLAPDEQAAEDLEQEEEEEEEERKKTSPHQQRRRTEKEEEEEEDGKEPDTDDGFEPEFQKGDRVEARFQGQPTYYSGRITRVYGDGACDVTYDDGDAESRVSPQLIRAAGGKKAVIPTSTTKKRDAYEDDFESD